MCEHECIKVLFPLITSVCNNPEQVGSEVTFSVVPDPTAGRGADKWNAVALELLPDGTLAEERRWPGAPPYMRQSVMVASRSAPHTSQPGG